MAVTECQPEDILVEMVFPQSVLGDCVHDVFGEQFGFLWASDGD